MSAVYHAKCVGPTFVEVQSTDPLLDNFESGEGNYCFGKTSGIIREFWIQKPVGTLRTGLF